MWGVTEGSPVMICIWHEIELCKAASSAVGNPAEHRFHLCIWPNSDGICAHAASSMQAHSHQDLTGESSNTAL